MLALGEDAQLVVQPFTLGNCPKYIAHFLEAVCGVVAPVLDYPHAGVAGLSDGLDDAVQPEELGFDGVIRVIHGKKKTNFVIQIIKCCCSAYP